MQLQRHDANVEITDHKVSPLEQIDHCGERPVDQACIDRFTDKHLMNRLHIFLRDGQLKEQQHNLKDKNDKEK